MICVQHWLYLNARLGFVTSSRAEFGRVVYLYYLLALLCVAAEKEECHGGLVLFFDFWMQMSDRVGEAGLLTVSSEMLRSCLFIEEVSVPQSMHAHRIPTHRPLSLVPVPSITSAASPPTPPCQWGGIDVQQALRWRLIWPGSQLALTPITAGGHCGSQHTVDR